MRTGARLHGAEMSSQSPACLQAAEMPILATEKCAELQE